MNLQFVHSAFECLLRCSRFICLQRQRQSFPTAATCLSASAQRASLSLCLSASGPAKVRGNAASPLSPSCLSSNCTLLLHMQQVYAPTFQHMLKMKTHCTCNRQGIPPTITRIFASTQIPITKIQMCSSEEENHFSF